ncbi:MAG TPA: hypothetical protein VHD85_20555 [Terracidiphilus sp.]|nr:hypothetical protein [Terracidiphilus sp.]
MRTFTLILLSSAFIIPAFSCIASAQKLELANTHLRAEFGAEGLQSAVNIESKSAVSFTHDGWQIAIDGTDLSSEGMKPRVDRASADSIVYHYNSNGYGVDVTYKLGADWAFISKRIAIVSAPQREYTIHRVTPWILKAETPIASDFIPSTYIPQLGANIEESRAHLPGKDFGEFLRFAGGDGAMLAVQNPYLEVARDGQFITISYAPEMLWQQAWGNFESDAATLGAYHLTGHRLPREMVLEWHLPDGPLAADGMDEAEIAAYTQCVHAYLIDPSPEPISVEVGWTLNDYQIDVGTEEGRAEYKKIIDTASELGIKTLLYGPGNSKLADHADSADTWGWEYVLWLGLGEKIRKGEWNPAKDAIPTSVSTMLDYAKQKHVGLLAYVYPSIPFGQNPGWIVPGGHTASGEPFGDAQHSYATLASRSYQDFLIHDLIAFQKRTGIAGYSFDYTFLNLPGSSSYAQWYGWRRVIETLRRQDPAIVIDGRQSYQLYGPWSWLAGSYPHPTGNDEQPESFKGFPDLHFDRVSGDRVRYVNYWYRNYQFAPEEVIPGYATHQTERSREVNGPDGPHGEMMYTRFRPRDWDFLGYKYSFLSSIATGGWNNVVDIIPARDPEEAAHFSAQDKGWIRHWLEWTVENKEYLRHTRTILGQPALGRVDGTAAIRGDKGYIFLFNPNYKQLSARFSLDDSIGLKSGDRFLLRELYPQAGMLIGKPHAGLWQRGDTVDLNLDGTSATVLEVVPAGKLDEPILFNSAALNANSLPTAELNGSRLSILHAAGEPGTERKIGVLLPHGSTITAVTVNGGAQRFTQAGSYIEADVRFAGVRFAQAEQVEVEREADGGLNGSFAVPQRVFDQLAVRNKQWPIPWTREDYETTWLAPERLLLFVQLANVKDPTEITAELDGQPLALTPAYTSVRPVSHCFVGYYADLSGIAASKRHTIELRAPQLTPGQLQGIFFDNVLPQFTESIVH